MSKDFNVLCEKEMITHEVVPPYTPNKNGNADRKNRTIMNIVRSMLRGKHLPNELLGEDVSATTYILNRCSTNKIEGITPAEYWYGVKPKLSHMKLFGSIAHRYVSDQLIKMLDDKSSQIIMIGCHSTGGYKLLDPLNKQVVINKDMVINEMKEWDWKDNVKKDPIRILCDESTSEAGREVSQKQVRGQAGISRPQRTRNMHRRL